MTRRCPARTKTYERPGTRENRYAKLALGVGVLLLFR
jgi:hypothetical protein